MNFFLLLVIIRLAFIGVSRLAPLGRLGMPLPTHWCGRMGLLGQATRALPAAKANSVDIAKEKREHGMWWVGVSSEGRSKRSKFTYSPRITITLPYCYHPCCVAVSSVSPVSTVSTITLYPPTTMLSRCLAVSAVSTISTITLPSYHHAVSLSRCLPCLNCLHYHSTLLAATLLSRCLLSLASPLSRLSPLSLYSTSCHPAVSCL